MFEKEGKILIVDDNVEILKALKYFLEEYFAEIVIEKNPNNIPALLKKDVFDLFILDMNFSPGETSGKEGIFWMHQIKKTDPGAIIIFITAYGDIELSVKAIKQGAADFIPKPWNGNKLLETVISAMKLRKSREGAGLLKKKQQANRKGHTSDKTFLIGKSASMIKIWGTIEKVSQTDANVLILGENGTGKSLIARAIHSQSLRNKEKFVKVDVGSLTETLFESELYGHKKGAFTDAFEERTGKIEEADRGTLFLDEIANIPLHLQSKFLTVLQNKEFTKIGSNQNIKIDIRFITATNADLFKLVKLGKFREDLLYRINTIQIEIPPLRERLEDLPILFNHFLAYYSDYYNRPIPNVEQKIMERLKKHSWPGNIRELEHIVEKAVILSTDNKLNLDDFIFPGQKINITDSLNLENHEKNLILKALEKSKGNYSKAAKELGIARKTLYNKIEKYGL